MAKTIVSPAQARAASLSHDDLCRIAARYMRGMGYTAFVETGSIHCMERADVIGWLGMGASMLVEVKRSRSDFNADAKKTSRLYSDLGFGVMRYYLCPAGLLQPGDMPLGWGLLWAYEDRVNVKLRAKPFNPERAAVAEKRILTALINRMDSEIRELYTVTGRPLPTRYQ